MNREIREMERQIINIAEDCKGYIQTAMDELTRMQKELKKPSEGNKRRAGDV